MTTLCHILKNGHHQKRSKDGLHYKDWSVMAFKIINVCYETRTVRDDLNAPRGQSSDFVLLNALRSLWPSDLRRRSESRRGHGYLSLVKCYVLAGRDLCDRPITRPQKPYRLRCVIVCGLETSRMSRPWSALGCCAREDEEENAFCLRPLSGIRNTLTECYTQLNHLPHMNTNVF